MFLLASLVALALPANATNACGVEFAAAPDRYDSALCFYREASSSGHWSSAIEALQQRTQRYPRQAWTRLVTGYLQMEAGAARTAATSYQAAAQQFHDQDQLRGELLATINLTAAFNRLGEAAAAEEAIERVRALGRQSNNAELKLRAINAEVEHRLSQGDDPGALLPALSAAEQSLDQIDSYWLRRETRNLLGALLQTLGKPVAASERYRALMVDTAAANDLNGHALAQFNLANALLVAAHETPRQADRTAIAGHALSALHQAIRAGNPRLRAISHRLLAELSFLNNPELATRHLNACAQLSTQHELGRPGSECAWLRARIVASTNPKQAQSLVRKAQRFAEDANDPFYRAFATRHQLRILWQTTAPEAAYRASLQALNGLDELRAKQTALNGARVMSAWARDYQWLASQALRVAAAAQGVEREQWIGRALSVSERMRALGLRQALESSNGDTTQTLPQSLPQSHTQTPTQPLAPSLSDTLPLQHLSELRSRLAVDEALLVLTNAPQHSIQGESAGDSWALLIHRAGVTLRALPDRGSVGHLNSLLSAQLRNAASSATSASVLTDAAQQRLLGTLLQQAPMTTRRLTIIADPTFAATPLAALTNPRTGRALIEDYSLTHAPSLTSWYQQRGSRATPQQRGLLMIANPRLAGAGANLPELPAAEQAARAMTHLFETRLRSLTGDTATIANLQQQLADQQIGTVHFATHTAIEAQSPVLVLADEQSPEHQVATDGRLRPAALETLNLSGRLVVFAACASATGETLRGEGTLGLVRSALIAGASSVIGTLWPIRDDYALAFSSLFYRELNAGHRVDEALAAAQRQARRNGLPAELWAAYVLHGDSRFRIEGAAPLRRLLASSEGR